MDKPDPEVQITTPEQDAQLAILRQGLAMWLKTAEETGMPHELALTALMLFSASGAASNGVPREQFIKVMGLYYDLYESALQKRKNSGEA